MDKRLRSTIPLFLAATALAGACGGSARNESGGSIGGPGGSSSGSGGDTSVACPETPPDLTEAEQCVRGLNCSYSVECRSGPLDLTFSCTPNGSSVVQWEVVSKACSFPFDSCSGTNAHCQNGNWVTQEIGGHASPCSKAPCPEAKPAPGQATCVSCPDDCGVCGGGIPCGYPCSYGDGWTVAKQFRAGPGCTEGVWLFDGACRGDCSKEEIALNGFVNANKSCTTTADCTIMRSDCAFAKETCGGFYVNANTDLAKWNEYSAALTACAQKPESEWNCVPCEAIDSAPECRSGHCMAKR